MHQYQKVIPKFYQELLGQLSKVNIFTVETRPPSEMIHYQPTKQSINIHTSEIIKLSHELAHMLETKDNSRLLKPDYGMKSYFPTTRKGQLQAIAREARTRGIQTRLVEISFGRCQMLFHRMAGALVSPPGPIAKFKAIEEVNEWSKDIVFSSYKNWNRDKILDVWKQKSEVINNWIETKEE